MRRRLLALLGVIACVLLSGCDVRGTFEERDDGRFKVDLTTWDYYDLSFTDDSGRIYQMGVEPCAGLTAREGLDVFPLHDPQDPRRRGCRLVGVLDATDLVGYRDYKRWLTRSTERTVLHIPQSEIYSARTTHLQKDWGKEVPGQVFDVTATFAGPVLFADAAGHIEGNTVHWTTAPAADSVGMQAVAMAPGRLSPSTWTGLYAASGALVGAILAALALAIGRRRRRPAIPTESPDVSGGVPRGESDAATDGVPVQPDGLQAEPEAGTSPDPEVDDWSEWAPDADR